MWNTSKIYLNVCCKMSEVIQLTVLTESSNYLFLFQFPTKPAVHLFWSSSFTHESAKLWFSFCFLHSHFYYEYLFVNCDFLSLFSLSLFSFFFLSLFPANFLGWIKLILNTQMFSIPLMDPWSFIIWKWN